RRRHAAARRLRFRGRIDDRRIRLRHDQDGDLVHGGGPVVDPHLGRTAAAVVRRGAAHHRRAIRSALTHTRMREQAPSPGMMMPMVDETHPVVEVVGATVRFPAELALDRVDFRMFPGEVHSLMGENGAGKSTLIKALTGALPLDAGVIRLNGERMRFSTPHDALASGISTVYQEIDLLPNLTVAENIWLGREPRRLGVDRKSTRLNSSHVKISYAVFCLKKKNSMIHS